MSNWLLTPEIESPERLCRQMVARKRSEVMGVCKNVRLSRDNGRAIWNYSYENVYWESDVPGGTAKYGRRQDHERRIDPKVSFPKRGHSAVTDNDITSHRCLPRDGKVVIHLGMI